MNKENAQKKQTNTKKVIQNATIFLSFEKKKGEMLYFFLKMNERIQMKEEKKGYSLLYYLEIINSDERKN